MTALATIPAPPEDLITAAQRGDREALDELLRAHLPAIEAVCRRRLGPGADAEDAAQETIVRALRALDQLRDAERVRAWLCRIAERVCFDILRGDQRRNVALSENLPAADRPDELAERWDEARQVRAGLQTLSERPRLALWMRDALGAPVPAVANELGVTEGSARVLLARARAQLRLAFAGMSFVVPGLWSRLRVVRRLLAKAAMVVPATAVVAGLVAFDPAPALIPAAPQELVPAAVALDSVRAAAGPAAASQSAQSAQAAPATGGAAADRAVSGETAAPRQTSTEVAPGLTVGDQEPAEAPAATIGIGDATDDDAATLEALLYAGEASDILQPELPELQLP